MATLGCIQAKMGRTIYYICKMAPGELIDRVFNVLIGGSFTVIRENIISRVTRTRTTFIVEDTIVT